MSKLTIDDEAVKNLLSSVYRRGVRTYCRIAEDGSMYVVPIRADLIKLGMSPKVAAELIKEANLPKTPEPEEDPPVIEAAEVAVSISDKLRGKFFSGFTPEIPLPADEDEDEFEDLPEDEPVEEDSVSTMVNTVPTGKKNKRQHYQLIQQGEYWGCFNSEEVTVVLYRTRREAERHIHNQQNHREVYKAFYSSGNNSNRHNEY
jgi:hypothetical protein